MCTPRLPLVFGNPTRPRSSSSSLATPATRTASAKSVPGCGSRSMRSSSGWSLSSRRHGQGWKVIAPIWAAQHTTATSVGQISAAVRPEGNVTSALSTYSGAPFIIRFW